MNEDEIESRLLADPFIPFRIHLVSGKTMDILAPGTAFALSQSLLILRKPDRTRVKAEGYDVISYVNIERIEQLEIGKRPTGKRKPA